MEDTSIFTFESFNWQEAHEEYGYYGGQEVYKGEHYQQPHHLLDTADWGDIESFCSNFSFDKLQADDHLSSGKVATDSSEDELLPVHSDFQMEFPFQYPKKPFRFPPAAPHAQVPNKETKDFKPLASLEILSNFRASQQKRPHGQRLDDVNCTTRVPANCGGGRMLSTEEVMRVAGARYIQFADQRMQDGNLAALTHPFGSMLSSLSQEETKDVELAHLLLAAAERVANQQYDRASRLLTQCDYFSSAVGNPVQRVVYYFADALRDRIDRETGRSIKGHYGHRWGEDMEEKMMGLRPSLVACHQLAPFSQIMQFTCVQLILDSVASCRRIHLVDFCIRLGLHWTVLMQALSVRQSCPVELIKISAVGTSREAISETGTRLMNFANELGLHLVFNEVIVGDMKDLREDMFEREEDEAVVVYASLVLRTMLVQPERLENVMRVARRLRPCVMTVTEVEANHNSLSFNNRFIEALFYFSAWFDCFDACMARNDPNRIDTEASFMAVGIRSIVAAEGSERVIRNVRIDVWRSFLARFGYEEVEVGQMIVYQAGLILKQFACGGSCTVEMNGKCLTSGWKGTPFHSVSAWKVK